MVCPHRPLPLLLLVVLGLAACAQLPGHRPSAAEESPAQAVHELDMVVAADGGIPIVLQYWERNTLVIDLQAVPPTGEVVLSPRQGQDWPVRLAFRAAPGRFGMLEVKGAQRELLPVSGERGAGVVTIPLAPTVHAGATRELRLRWGPASVF